MVEISFQNPPSEATKCIFLSESLAILGYDASIVEEYPVVKKFLESSSGFDGKFASMKLLSALSGGSIVNTLLIGLGNIEKLSELQVRRLGKEIVPFLLSAGIKDAEASIELHIGEFTAHQWNANVAYGALLASYRFEQLKKDKEKRIIRLHFSTLQVESSAAFESLQALSKGIFFAKDCINLPPNYLYPETYAKKIQEEFSSLPSVTVEVLEEAQMNSLGMGGMLCVGMGSSQESKLVVVKYAGASPYEAPVALVGKGVTFDSGGISLKPSAHMEKMKSDMGGSAAVLGALKALALQEAKVNVVCLVGLVENMPGGRAQRPSDVITTLSGKTVEVLNTDAEGRLILADLLWHAHSSFAPKIMIDVATLTGAIVVALGSTYAGVFSQDTELVEQLKQAGEETGDLVWQLPLHENYDKMLQSQVADIANISSPPGEAGSCTAAQFLKHFVGETRWAHLDIAGVAFSKGATGFGVALLCKLIEKFYTQK